MPNPRCLAKEAAAWYVGVTPTTLDKLVLAGDMPPPLDWSVRKKVWDRAALDVAIDALQGASSSDPEAQARRSADEYFDNPQNRPAARASRTGRRGKNTSR